jgi:periodic tryptophan protein 2
LTTAVKFSSTGREWAAATSQGLQVYSLDEDLLFAPTDLDITITPQAVDVALSREEYSLALNMALQLGPQMSLKKVFSKIPMNALNLVIKSVDVRMLRDIIRFIANELASSVHLEFYLQWTHEILQNYGKILNSDSMPYRESLRALLRAISIHEKEIMRYAEDNHFTLNFITSQLSGDDINEVDVGDDDDDDNEINNKYNYNEDNNINNNDDDNDMKILKKSNHKRKQPTIEVNNVNSDDDNTKPVKASKGKGKSKAKKIK